MEDVPGLLVAQANGADRVELCAALPEGGLTPSIGTVRRALAVARVPVHVLIRPRRGNFVYTDEEQAVMLEDLSAVREAGAAGAVIGCLGADHHPERAQLGALMAAARPLSVTFHRAFDEVPRPFDAVDLLAELGVQRILTAGQQASAVQGKGMLRDLIAHAGDRITILGCGGLRPWNVREVLSAAPLSEIHFAAHRDVAASPETDPELVRDMRAQVSLSGSPPRT